jgi:hypothetical protein
MRTNISAILSAETTIKSLSINNIGGGFNLFGQQRLTASNGVVYLDKIRFSEKKIGICLDKIHYLYRGFVSITAPLFFNFKHLQYGTTETTISIGTLSPAYPG